MNIIFYITFLVIFSACATYNENAVSYKPNVAFARKVLPIMLTARFQSQINTKYAYLTANDVNGGIENCSQVEPGDPRDGYLMSVMCLTYFNLLKTYDLKLVQSEEEFNKKKSFRFEYLITEDLGTADKVWSWSNLLTLTVIPYWGKREFELNIVEQLGEKSISDTTFKTHFTEFRSIVLLPAMPFTDGYQIGTRKAVANLLSQIDNHFRNFK